MFNAVLCELQVRSIAGQRECWAFAGSAFPSAGRAAGGGLAIPGPAHCEEGGKITTSIEVLAFAPPHSLPNHSPPDIFVFLKTAPTDFGFQRGKVDPYAPA